MSVIVLIETALAEVDELLILIYDAPEVTPVPLSVRAGWLRALYPAARVLEAWDGPVEVGYTPAVMAAQEAYVLERLDGMAITHFFSSEPYGQHMSAALGAVDRRVDEARTRMPVSGTAVRAAPYAHRALLSPAVYRDLVANIAVLGAPSTGKTTLCAELARVFDTVWMPEYGREYWDTHQVERRLSPAQLVEIAEGHLAREEALLCDANRFLFTDTNALTTLTFARYYHGVPLPRLCQLADRAGVRYDLTFLCETDIPYEDTWDRSGEANREAFQRQVVADLQSRGIPFLRVAGSLTERVETVRRVLSGFHKYMDVTLLFR